MRKLALFAVTVVFVGRAAQAAVPGQMNYQGYLTDGAGAPVDGLVDMVFRLYDGEFGTEIWTEDHWGTNVVDGLFSVRLGEAGSLDASAFAGEAWLEIEVDGEVMTPRVRVVSVGYSYLAALAELTGVDSVNSASIVDGSIADADINAAAAVNTGKLAQMGAADGQVLTWSDGSSRWEPAAGGTGAWTVSGNDVYYDAGNVGIGTTSPLFPLDVVFSGTGAVSTYDSAAGIETHLGSDGTRGYVGTVSAHEFRILQNNAPRVNVTASGVGIGDVTPEGTLDVQGTVVSSGAARFGAGGTGAPLAYNAVGTGAASHSGAGEVTDVNDVFVTDDLELNGTLFADGNIYVGTDVDSDFDAIYFDTGTARYLWWDDAETRFEFNAPLSVRDAIEAGAGAAVPVAYNRFGASGASHTAAGEVTDASDVFVTGDLELNGSLFADRYVYVGTDSDGDNDAIYFDTGTVERLMWDDAQARFEFSDDLSVDGVMEAAAGAVAPVAYNRFGPSAADSGVVTGSSDVFVSGDLEVDGGLYADGNVSVSGNITFPTGSEKTRYLSIAYAAFSPANSTTGANYSSDSANGLSGTGVGTRTFSASVNLPHGATITYFEAYLLDDADTDASFTLRRRLNTSNSVATVASVSSSGTGGFQWPATSTINESLVDNLGKNYYVFATWTMPGSGSIRFFNILIHYTITTPLP